VEIKLNLRHFNKNKKHFEFIYIFTNSKPVPSSHQISSEFTWEDVITTDINIFPEELSICGKVVLAASLSAEIWFNTFRKFICHICNSFQDIWGEKALKYT
jgi:hypothetical protein